MSPVGMVPQGPGERNWGMAEDHLEAGAWGHQLDDGDGLLCGDPFDLVQGQLGYCSLLS